MIPISPAGWILIGVLAGPVAEIAVFLAVAVQIGLVATLLVQFAISLCGVAVIRSAGRGRISRLRRTLAEGLGGATTSTGGSLLTVLAGILLVIPGFLTDAIGAMLLIPAVRGWLRRTIRETPAPRRNSRSPGPVVDLGPDEWRRVPEHNGRPADPPA